MSLIKQDMSLFIPRVFSNITSEKIKVVIENYGLGQVQRVDLVSKGTYNSAYIHFKFWYNNPDVLDFQNRASDPLKKAIITYEAPWYWIVLENTSAKRIGPERRKEVINIRVPTVSSFPVAPIAPGLNYDFECEDINLSEKGITERTIPLSVLEDLIWEMEQMQGEINELRDAIEKAGLLDTEKLMKDAVTGNYFIRKMIQPPVYECVGVKNLAPDDLAPCDLAPCDLAPEKIVRQSVASSKLSTDEDFN
jgi:hypothetical protein